MIAGKHALATSGEMPNSFEWGPAHLVRIAPPLVTVAPHCPDYIGALIDKAIEKKRDDRHATMMQFGGAIRASRERYVAETQAAARGSGSYPAISIAPSRPGAARAYLPPHAPPELPSVRMPSARVVTPAVGPGALQSGDALSTQYLPSTQHVQRRPLETAKGTALMESPTLSGNVKSPLALQATVPSRDRSMETAKGTSVMPPPEARRVPSVPPPEDTPVPNAQPLQATKPSQGQEPKRDSISPPTPAPVVVRGVIPKTLQSESGMEPRSPTRALRGPLLGAAIGIPLAALGTVAYVSLSRGSAAPATGPSATVSASVAVAPPPPASSPATAGPAQTASAPVAASASAQPSATVAPRAPHQPAKRVVAPGAGTEAKPEETPHF
jgi:hypothetical protein